ncbi:helix-turn-helix domain-containing protein [Gemmatimonas sp.]|uniref:helix-turn-helix domain-containing protein n=1 Tax=Gemmatimonas sp. TaxID=1962908 RepID=UPI00286E9CA6|nr:helix-turn-helix domain-containing protein [Gemmatimonas sp.]
MRLHTTTEIGTAVREARRRRRLTQTHLADMIGASRQWVQRLEAGRAGVELGLTLRALLAVGVTLEVRDSADAPDATPEPTAANWLLQAPKASYPPADGASAVTKSRLTRSPVHGRPKAARTVAIPGWNDVPSPVDAPDAAQLRKEQRAVTAAPRKS